MVIIGKSIIIIDVLLFCVPIYCWAVFFPLCSDDCRSTYSNCHLIMFADDTILLSLLSGPSQHHSPALQELVE